MENKKNFNITKKVKIQISITICFGVFLILLSNIYIYGSENIEVNDISYVENNGNFIIPITNKEEAEIVNNSATDLENPKITISNSKTLLDYKSDENPEEYVKENQEDLVYGYELTIDGKDKLYLEDDDLLSEAKNKIMAILLNDDVKYTNYLETGQYDDIIIANKDIYKIEVDNEFTVTKKYVPKDEVITKSDELVFDLFHKESHSDNFKKNVYTVKQGESFEDILAANNMTEYDFFVSNIQYQGEPLLSEGEEIVTNKAKPMINVAIYYKTQQEEVEEFDTIRKDDDELAYGEEELEQKGKNGLSLVTYDEKMVNGKVVSKKMSKKESIKDPVSRIIREGTDESSSSGGVYGNITPSGDTHIGGFIWPTVSRSVSRGLTYGHNGTDIMGSYGDPEYAAADGVVAAAGWSPYGGGYEVQIDHGGGLYTVYSHMAQMPNVSAGQSVYQGQVIGYMGQTGNAFGVHLHFEVRVGCSGDAFSGTPVEPAPYMN